MIERKVIELVDIGTPNLWEHFLDGVLKACDEVCEKKMGEKQRRYMVVERRADGSNIQEERRKQGDISK